jgi:hypothetical protein
MPCHHDKKLAVGSKTHALKYNYKNNIIAVFMFSATEKKMLWLSARRELVRFHSSFILLDFFLYTVYTPRVTSVSSLCHYMFRPSRAIIR